MRLGRSAIGRSVMASAIVAGCFVAVPIHSANAGSGTCHGHAVTIEGTDGDDKLEGTSGDDVIDGLGGDDVIFGGGSKTSGGRDYICGGPGSDTISGGIRDQTIWGDGGADKIRGAMGYDVIFGGDGRDRLFGNDQGDELNGNGGKDYLHPGNTATARGGDFAYGGLGADVLVATGYGIEGGPSELYGNKGRDRLRGSDEEHWLDGGPGNDVLEGGAAAFLDAPSGVNVDMRRSRAHAHGTDKLSGIIGLVGSTHNDVLKGSGKGDYIYGLDGNDRLNGRGGRDILVGGDGNDSCKNGEQNYAC